jgi:hypothetical protein
MKKLKQIAENKLKALKRLSKVVDKNFMKTTRKGYKKNSVDRIEFTKAYELRTEAEKEYIEAMLNYINSTEYVNGGYKTNNIKYQNIIIKINQEINRLKEDYPKAKSANEKDEIKAFITGLNQCKKAYSKKPGNYNTLDVKLLSLRPITKNGHFRFYR